MGVVLPCRKEMYSSADMEMFPSKNNNNHLQWSTKYAAGPRKEVVMWMNIHDHDPSIGGLHQFGQHDDDNTGYVGIRSSKYLGPAQDLLKEFCDIRKHHDDAHHLHDTAPAPPSLHSLDLLQLQIRKTNLIQIIHQVDRRYKHYCNQMRGVVSSFEDVAGDGAAMLYSSMASKVISKHFRCLRDRIASQIKATKKAINEEHANAAAGATNKGELPRLRLLDQALRQKKALQQPKMMGSHPWRPQRGLPLGSVSLLRAWLFEHFLHPYPSDVDKHMLAHQTGLSRSQVSNWFINARVRLWKPMVEEMYTAELKEDLDKNEQPLTHLSRPNHCDRMAINITSKNAGNEGQRNPKFVEIDFSVYGDRRSLVDGGGVSLTLAFPPAAAYQTEECETVSYSVLEECEEGQNLVYRDLDKAQLLHDLAV